MATQDCQNNYNKSLAAATQWWLRPLFPQGTGGFRSCVGLDRTAGTGVVLLSATAAPVGRQGFRLLAGLFR
jgi:hypothetical protein